MTSKQEPSEFDKELEQAIDVMLSEQRQVNKIGQLPFNKTREAIKQAVERHIIGENQQDCTDTWDCACGATHTLTEDYFKENNLRSEQRKALWGKS